MPSVESFKTAHAERTKAGKKAAKTSPARPQVKASSKAAKVSAKAPSASPKRRLAQEGMSAQSEGEQLSIIDMDTTSSSQGASQTMEDQDHKSHKTHKSHAQTHHTHEHKDTDFHFNFTGASLLRHRFPKAVKLSEVVVDEWLKDGKFENLPIEHPIVEVLAQKGLRRAKELEQKFFQDPRVEKAVVQALTLGFKVQNLYAEAKKKVGRR